MNSDSSMAVSVKGCTKKKKKNKEKISENVYSCYSKVVNYDDFVKQKSKICSFALICTCY